MESKKEIRLSSPKEIALFLEASGEDASKAALISQYVWKKHLGNFDQMNGVSTKLIYILKSDFYFEQAPIINYETGEDQTQKFLFQFKDSQTAEGVLIPGKKAFSACLSSQIGCKLSCSFCATAQMGYKRDLTASEILTQFIEIQNHTQIRFKNKLSRLVFMGMGEPLLNFDNVSKALGVLTSKEQFAFPAGHVTVSTAGIAPKIVELAKVHPGIQLAVSLHSAIEEKRSQIMPINRKYNLITLAQAIKSYCELSRNTVTIEYVLLKNFNDSLNDAKQLALYCRQFPCKVNIITFNHFEASAFRPSHDYNLMAFAGYLESKDIKVSIRKSRGEDIMAACGQLANQNT